MFMGDVGDSERGLVPSGGAPAGSASVVIARRKDGPGMFVRILWYVFIGWWLSGIVTVGAYLLALTVLGLPVAFMIFNRMPTILTLRPRTIETTHEVAAGVTYVTEQTAHQRAWWKRAVYFVLVGWWAGAIWSGLAWLIQLTIIGIPVTLMMYNRLPAVVTLRRH
jgi:uncharacterized membrane protein YccF (DUF307 family)